jgi:competence protein ComEA
MASTSPDRVSHLLEAMTQAEQDEPRARGHRAGRMPSLFTTPAALREARVRVGPPVVVGAVLLLVAVVVVLGIRVAWAQRSAEPTPVPRPESALVTAVPTEAVAAAPAGVADAGAPARASAASGPSYVHVIGAVKQSGVVDVPAGSRVSDVVEAAGGLTADADPSRVNLARPVLDGERIWVPVEGEDPPVEVAAPVSEPGASGPAQAAAPSSGPGASSAAPVDLNTADSTALQALPGIGPVTAEAILTWRDEHTRFSTVEELEEVSGIGPRTLERLRPLVVVTP